MGQWFEKRSIGALPALAAQRFGRREALTFEGQRWTFEEFDRDVDRAAKALLAAGVKPGDKVSLWFPNRPAWLHIFFGALKIGAVLLPLNTRLRTHDIEYAIKASDTSTLIVAEQSGPVDFLSMVLDLLPELRDGKLEAGSSARCPLLARVIVAGDRRGAEGALDWEALLAEGERIDDAQLAQLAAAVDPDAPALIMFTSGSTGNPKGVVHCHNLIRNATDQVNRLAVTNRDVNLMYLPLFHAFGLYVGALFMVVANTRIVLMEHFDPDEALRLVEAEGCTMLHGFDTHFADLLRSPERAKRDTSSLRIGVFPSGMKSSVPVAQTTQEQLCLTVSAWGMTEVGCCAALGYPTDSDEVRCMDSGAPLPGYEFRVVDAETGRVCAPGEIGELQCRGYMMLMEYYKNPEATAATFSDDGWFRTGDQVLLQEDGSMRFLGRYKEMLKVGGENVDPFEVEAFLMGHPAVAQVQVIGMPDERLSEVPVACVIPKADHQLDLEALQAYCKGQIASFKVPRKVMLMEAFPMTSSGKVQRFKLREDISQGKPG